MCWCRRVVGKGYTYEDSLRHDSSGICATEDVKDQVPDDFIVADEVWVFLFGPQEVVHVVFLPFELFEILDAFEEGLDAESGRVREVREFVREIRVLSEEFVEGRYLAYLWRCELE